MSLPPPPERGTALRDSERAQRLRSLATGESRRSQGRRVPSRGGMGGGRLLLADDDEAYRMTTAALLEQDGYDVTTVPSASEALRALGTSRFDLVMLDLRMPGLDALHAVAQIRQRGEDLPVLIVSGYGTVQNAVEALHSGADDVLTKPVEPAVLSARIAQLLEHRPPLGGGDRSDHLPDLIGRSPAIRAVSEAIRLVAPTDATVLIGGATGTGKELVARAVHAGSSRRTGPFVAVNCAAIGEGVMDSELFGHARGAFTGAVRDRVGLFPSADGGTIFLDEVGDMPPFMQYRLLRVLQEREVTPVGKDAPVQVDVRVIAATNRDLREEVTAGRFREDLFYRLNVFGIHLPALRERRGDIPLLVRHFLRQSGAQGRHAACTPMASRLLQRYDWPGNIRELIAVLQSARVRSAGERIDVHHLPAEVRGFQAQSAGPGGARSRYQVREGSVDEREAIAAALADAGGVRSRAAALLGMGRTTLWRKLRHLGDELR